MNYDVIVIGAGLGGLTAGAKLAREGMKVLVLEQHNRPGGCATTFKRGEFTLEVANISRRYPKRLEPALVGPDLVVRRSLRRPATKVKGSRGCGPVEARRSDERVERQGRTGRP